nr:hypothetical protein [Tanacetum cinerariifolium]
AREGIPFDLFRSTFPERHVARESDPRRQVARDSQELSPGKMANVVVCDSTYVVQPYVMLEVFSTWMVFEGNTHDLGSFGEETDEIKDLHQIIEEALLTERGDGVTSIKRRRRDPSGDGVWNLKTTSGRDQLKEDLESST